MTTYAATVFAALAGFTALVGATTRADETAVIRIRTHYDSGIAAPTTIAADRVTFDFREIVFPYLDCELWCSPRTLTLTLWLNARGTLFYAHQGLYVSRDGVDFALQPLTKIRESRREANTAGKRETVTDTEFEAVVVVPPGGRIRVATSDPYGRDHLEELLCATKGGGGRWRFLRRENRPVLLFEIGEDDGRKPIHTIIAGEDCRETEGKWVADRMIRSLAADPALARAATQHAILRICPMLSPYTGSTPGHNSYASSFDGRDAYGASKWNLDPSPPEIELLKELIVESVRQRRLGLVLTIHSWWAGKPFTEIETIKQAGANTLSPERQEWALAAMRTLTEGVPHARTLLADKAWYPGLLREFALARHNAITFRMEVTTQNQAQTRGAATAAARGTNLARRGDLGPVIE